MCLNAGAMGRQDAESETLIPTFGGGFDVAHSLRGEGFDASEDGTGRGTPLVPVAFDTTQITSAANYSNPKPGDPCHPLAAGAHPPAIAIRTSQTGSNGWGVNTDGVAYTLDSVTQAVAFDWQSGGDARGLDPKDTAQLQRSQVPATMQGMAVRRLTPIECERLQGFPDCYTAIPWRKRPASDCPDGPRYKALGNSWAVPVVRWIGLRIQEVIA